MDLAVAGVGTTPITRDPVAPLPDEVVRVCRAALADAGIAPSEVDGLFCTPAQMSADPWMMYAANLGAALGFSYLFA